MLYLSKVIQLYCMCAFRPNPVHQLPLTSASSATA